MKFKRSITVKAECELLVDRHDGKGIVDCTHDDLMAAVVSNGGWLPDGLRLVKDDEYVALRTFADEVILARRDWFNVCCSVTRPDDGTTLYINRVGASADKLNSVTNPTSAPGNKR